MTRPLHSFWAWTLAMMIPAAARAESVAPDVVWAVCRVHGECTCGFFCSYGRCVRTPPPESETSCSTDTQCAPTCTGTVCRGGRCVSADAGAATSDLGATPDVGARDTGAGFPVDAPSPPEPPVDVPATNPADVPVGEDRRPDSGGAPLPPRDAGADVADTGTVAADASADVVDEASSDDPSGRVVVSCAVAPHRGRGDLSRALAAAGLCAAVVGMRRSRRR